MLLFSVGSSPSTARFSVVAFHHYSSLPSSLYLLGINAALLLPFQEWMQKLEAESKQNQILHKNVVISVFASSQLTSVKSYNFSHQTDVSAKHQSLPTVQTEKQKPNPPPSRSCWYPSLNTEKEENDLYYYLRQKFPV